MLTLLAEVCPICRFFRTRGAANVTQPVCCHFPVGWRSGFGEITRGINHRFGLAQGRLFAEKRKEWGSLFRGDPWNERAARVG
jgi:hypothetical protein